MPVLAKIERSLKRRFKIKSSSNSAKGLYRRPTYMEQPKDISALNRDDILQRCDIARLVPPGGIAVELGVALGEFSAALLETNPKIGHLYSIDKWTGERGHDDGQYKAALARLRPFRDRNTCIRLTFENAVDLFDDAYFDFIYVDGYAHTGQESGRTLNQWWAKLKPGGIFAGDDYQQNWPLVMEAVDKFAHAKNLTLYVFSPQSGDSVYARSPSWISFKPETV